MSTEERGYRLAIMAVGTALVALFAAAGLIGAFGNGIPQELWAAAGALSGALVGVLVPAPKLPTTQAATNGAAAVHRAAVAAATTAVQNVAAGEKAAANEALNAVKARAAQPPASGRARAVVADAVAQHTNALTADLGPAHEVTQAAAAAAVTTGNSVRPNRTEGVSWVFKLSAEAVKPVSLAIITYVALKVGIHMSDGAIRYPNCHVFSAGAPTAQAAPCAAALFQAATSLIALGSASGGALIGLFAPSPSSKGTS